MGWGWPGVRFGRDGGELGRLTVPFRAVRPLSKTAKTRYSYIMENDLKQQILDIVESARLARQEALKPGGDGYAFVSGYATAALERIAKLVEEA